MVPEVNEVSQRKAKIQKDTKLTEADSLKAVSIDKLK